MPTFDKKLFFKAAREGDLQVIQEQLSYEGADIECMDDDVWGKTVLFVATYHAQFDVANYLLANGAKTYCRSGYNKISLCQSMVEYLKYWENINLPHAHFVFKLLNNIHVNPENNLTKEQLGSLFDWAANNKFTGIIKSLIKAHNYNPTPEQRGKAIELAKNTQDIAFEKLLFNNEDFIQAVRTENLALLNHYLNELGVDPSQIQISEDRTNISLLHYAIKASRHDSIINRLLAIPNMPRTAREFYNCIKACDAFPHGARFKIYKKRLLDKLKPTLNELDENDETILIAAAKEGTLEEVQFWLSQGADVSVRNSKGLTVTDIILDPTSIPLFHKVNPAIHQKLREVADSKRNRQKLQEKFTFGLKVAGLVALGIFSIIGLGIGISLLFGFTPIGILAAAATVPFLGPVLTGLSVLGILIAGTLNIKLYNSKNTTTQAVASPIQHPAPPSTDNTDDKVATAALALHSTAPIDFQSTTATGQTPAALPIDTATLQNKK